MYDFKDAKEKIGYLPYSNITSLHERVDKWALLILKEIQEIKDAKN